MNLRKRRKLSKEFKIDTVNMIKPNKFNLKTITISKITILDQNNF